MDYNKENIRLKKTKIPVPLDPLPLLPKHLIIKNVNQIRAPLKTIDGYNANEPSTSSQSQKSLEEVKIKKDCLKTSVIHVSNARFKKNWNKNIFEDGHITNSKESTKCEHKDVIPNDSKRLQNNKKDMKAMKGKENDSASDDDIEKNETDLKNKGDQKNKLLVNKSEKVAALVTPTALLEHKAIKNIKKSLKRPHSRELQGLSPVEKEKAADDKVKRRLFFDQLEDKRNSDPWSEAYNIYLTKEYTDDIFPYLSNVQRKPLGIPYISDNRRACAINWLVKINGVNGNAAVIQTACWYLDSFLNLYTVTLNKLQVVAAACYWIALKLHGPTISASKVVVFGCNAFTADYLRCAEMKKFPTQPVIPQDFIEYLSWWCDDTREVEMAATFICLAGLIVDRSLCREYPSAVAAAAVKAAILLMGKKHLMTRLLMCPVYRTCLEKDCERSIVAILHLAVHKITQPDFVYNTLMKVYSIPPYNVANKIAEASKLLLKQPC